MPDSERTIPACKWRVAEKWCRRRINDRMCDAGGDMLPGGGGETGDLGLLTILNQIVKTVADREDLRCRVVDGKHCPRPPKKPRYGWKGRQLWADGKLLHTFAPQAHNQIAILRAFQQRRWSHEIVDPLGNAADLDYAKRLRDAAYGLNAAQGVIFFSTTASLRKIRWDYLGKEEWLLIPRTS